MNFIKFNGHETSVSNLLFEVSVLLFVLSPAPGYHSFEADCMGTKFSLLIDHDNAEKARLGAKMAFKEAERLNGILSDYDQESEVSQFSQSSYSGEKRALSKDLFKVLEHGNQLALETNGSFDMTIGHLSRLWRIARFRKKLPTAEKLTKALSLSGSDSLKLFPEKSEGMLTKPGILLDLGGIAKGYAADCMKERLTLLGLPRCLIDAGGDLVAGDPPRGKKGWRVKVGGIAGGSLPNLVLSNAAIATSGDIEQYIRFGGKKYSHLIDPSSGMGLISQTQLTVVAPTGLEADSLASAGIVLGIERSRSLFSGKKGTQAYFLFRKDDQICLTQIKGG